jgi:hypothetical protein
MTRFLIPAVSALALCVSAANAQDTPRWRVGVTLISPAKVLDVNSTEVPDSNSSHVDLGVGFGAELSRLWPMSAKGSAGVYARASLAHANAEAGGETWSPGWVVIGEAGARLRRQLSHAFGVNLGAGVAHWAGPDETAPFAGLGAILAQGEAGATLRIAPNLAIDLTANATRLGSDDDAGVSSGFVWRFILGVHHEK